MFQKSSSTAEAALASMETLEDKIETTNDGMENVKLDITVSIMAFTLLFLNFIVSMTTENIKFILTINFFLKIMKYKVAVLVLVID